MDKEELGRKLAGVMDVVSVCEGLIYAKTSGEIIMGQTLLEMDHAAIAKPITEMFKREINSAQKGSITDFTIGMDKGILLAVKKDESMLIGILGEDGKGSVGLLLRQLKNILK